MIIRIAAISSKAFMPRILKYEDKIPNIKIIPHIYENPKESESLLEHINDCDALLFVGPLPYFFAREKVKQKKFPAVYIESYEYKLTTSLLHIKMKGQCHLDELSIDLPDAKYAEQVQKELELSNVKWFIKDYSQIVTSAEQELNIEEIICFHKELWEKKKIKCALTSIDFVYKRLCELGIPCYSMIVPENTIYETIKRAADYGQLMIRKNSQIAVGVLTVNQDQSFLAIGGFNHDATIAIHQMLLEIGKSTEATVHQLGLDQFIIYGTRGSVEQIISNFQSPSFFEKVERLMNVTVSVGFGFGLTARAAEENTRIALYYANKNMSTSSVYLVTDEKEVVGPLNAEIKSFHLRSETREVLNVAEKTGMSVATVNKVIQFLKLRGENRFTAKDLAEYLEVSRRSSERILKKFAENQFAEAVGEEQPHQQGRPRSVYRMTFLNFS